MKLFFVRRVVGQSMLPGLQPGRVVFASSLKPYKKGSVVIADVDGREIIKRVKKLDNQKVWLMSDNPKDGQDSRHFGPISKSQVIATKI